MNTIRTDFLTELSLGEFLRKYLDENIKHNTTMKLGRKNIRPDYYSETHQLVVEFDGHHHYTYAKRAWSDIERDAALEDKGIVVVRVPYFIQLHGGTIDTLFGRYVAGVDVFNTYPHGFIDSQVIMPADFCSLGLQRYHSDLHQIGDQVSDEIFDSLLAKCESGLSEYEVFPADFVDYMIEEEEKEKAP